MLAYSHQVCSVALVEGYGLYTHNLAMASLISGCTLLIATDIGALLPDIDQANSTINQKLPVKLDRLFTHRGITHSILGFVVFVFVMHWLFNFIYSFGHFRYPLEHWWYCLWLGLVIGYLLHLIEDSFSQAGIRWGQPFTRYDKWSYQHYGVLLRPVHHFRDNGGSKKIPCRHWWGRGYKVGGNLEVVLGTTATLAIIIMTIWWIIRLIATKA